LALNAAIEAARAGEHGKGFAVVADEVRKLAERASNATKEIGGLIRNIQKTVGEAVISMEEGGKEVENGVYRANTAGEALSSILKAIEAVNIQAEQAAKASEKMSISANEMIASVDTVSAVVEQNTAATEEMAAGANEVSKSIENIADVSKENGNAVEKVFASVLDVSSQVQEVTSTAQSLEKMAKSLQEIVSQFKLN
jgi:methyl-accepting chemotaxis protein